VSYASELRGLLKYYLESRKVTDFESVCDLVVCDRIKSTLSESCLKDVLSIESSRDDGWLPIKELTECLDRFGAAKGDSFNPVLMQLARLHKKSGQKSHFLFDKFKGQTYSPNSNGGESIPKAATNIPTTPHKQITCYECLKPGHVRPYCPSLKKSAGFIPKASSKRVAVVDSSAVIETASAASSSTPPVGGRPRRNRPPI